MKKFERELVETAQYFATPRFRGITRLYSPRQVVEQRGSLTCAYPVATDAAEGFFSCLSEKISRKESITTFGPYSPGQAVSMKRAGIDGIYIGGWATSAKGSVEEDPGPDLASYPLSQVPDEAAVVVRALLTADRNQHFAWSRLPEKDQSSYARVDFRPFIIADADTGHGGEAHVRNLIRRFVEIGVPGYHIEDQKPGVKKCGHQAGKVMVAVDEQIKRLNAARFQLDIMKVPGLIVARTDAESATYLDSRGDERDHSFLLGATNADLPSCRSVSLAILRRIHELGAADINGHLLYRLPETEYEAAFSWLKKVGLLASLEEAARKLKASAGAAADTLIDEAISHCLEAWESQAGLKTFSEAVADLMAFQAEEGTKFDLSVEQWKTFAHTASNAEARAKATALGLNVTWDCELCRTTDGYYLVKGGIEYAIARSLAVAPFADLLWMETKTADLEDAKHFADAIHAKFPGKMLAYNLSPSFNWDSTGMSDEKMREFPRKLGEMGFVFNFITYGGHQIDGLAGEEFATSLRADGMLALARLQRRLRLIDSPYKTPQTLVGGPRLDGALLAVSGRTASTQAMGKGSTQFQHLIQIELPPRVLEEWLEVWKKEHGVTGALRAQLRPHSPGSALLELQILDASKTRLASLIFETTQDRHEHNILNVRDQNIYDKNLRRKRLMTLMHLFVVSRYRSAYVHYVSPTEDNHRQTERMRDMGIFTEVHTEVGKIIVATVNHTRVQELINAKR